MKKNNNKKTHLLNAVLFMPILIFKLIYFLSIKQFYWRDYLLFSGDTAIFVTSLWLLFFISICVASYYKIYNFYLKKFKPIVLLYLIINPFWIIFYYLTLYYIKNESSENSLWVLICILTICAIALKLYNIFYIKILKYLSSRKGS